ncbi:MAG: aa3-type cytochrome c oxidase subunit IV [Paracoccaceae bacterium]
MSDIKHEHGKMDISDQQETFRRFISFGLYLFYASLSAIIFLAIFNS